MSELTIATWNVHGCVGTDGREDPARVAEVVQRLDADVVGLQEIDDDALKQVAARTGLKPLAGATRPSRTGLFGNALLTRFPVEAFARHDMSISGREPRGVLDVVLRGGGGAMRVLVTHFGLRARERRRQVDLLLELLNASPASLVVLLGDFNEWRPRARTLQRLDEHFGPAPKPRTFPSWLPLLRLDRVWVWPRPALLGVQAWRGPGARRASDHLPVVARVATLD